MTRKTPEEIASFIINDDYQGSSFFSCAKGAAQYAYEEADEYPKVVEGTWQWAYQQMKEGRKVRRTCWDLDRYWHLDLKSDDIRDSDNMLIGFRPSFTIATDWELYKKKKAAVKQALDCAKEELKEQRYIHCTKCEDRGCSSCTWKSGISEETKNMTDKQPIELKEGQIVSIDGVQHNCIEIDMGSQTTPKRVVVIVEEIPQWEEVSHDEATEALVEDQHDVQTFCLTIKEWVDVCIDCIGNCCTITKHGRLKDLVPTNVHRRWRTRKKTT